MVICGGIDNRIKQVIKCKVLRTVPGKQKTRYIFAIVIVIMYYGNRQHFLSFGILFISSRFTVSNLWFEWTIPKFHDSFLPVFLVNWLYNSNHTLMEWI